VGNEELAVLKQIKSRLDEILKWTRFAGMQQLKNTIAQNLIDDISLIIYELSDGNSSTREVANVVGKSNVTVANYWKQWNKLGIVEQSPKYRGRFKRICSLEELGLTVPPMPHAKTDAKNEE